MERWLGQLRRRALHVRGHVRGHDALLLDGGGGGDELVDAGDRGLDRGERAGDVGVPRVDFGGNRIGRLLGATMPLMACAAAFSRCAWPSAASTRVVATLELSRIDAAVVLWATIRVFFVFRHGSLRRIVGAIEHASSSTGAMCKETRDVRQP
ncbi:hypothetical protein ABIB73_001576 [Bradyrhizobium sp. F1.4.3]